MTLPRLCFAACLLTACKRPDTDAAQQSTMVAAVDTAKPWRKPGDKIDSILPMPEYLRRFRAGLAQPARFTGGATSRPALARRFLAAIAGRDSAALIDLGVSRAEFAWLVFPDHLYAGPPYELDPEIFWMQLTAGNAKGVTRVLNRYQGHDLAYLGLDCARDTLQIKRGPARVWNCRLRYRSNDSVETRRLFGSIVERDGRVKLLSFANDF